MSPSTNPEPSPDRPAAEAGPLTGIRVIEVTKYIQGPMAGQVLASLGADVVKIEQVGRKDEMRNISMMHGAPLDERGRSWVYATGNRDKRALALDITTAAGRQLFETLVARSDVFLTNLRADGLERMGIDYESLRAVNPRIVYAHGGGLGFRGPLAKDPVQDTIGMAYSGFMDNSSPTDEPNYPPGSMSDVLTGSNLAAAIMAGLIRRTLTGEGSLVRTSQLQAMLWLQTYPVGLLASGGGRMARFDRSETTPLYSAYQTSDGWIAVAAIHDHQWPPLARVLGLAHLLDDPRFVDIKAIERNKTELAPLFEEAFRGRTTNEWWQAFREAGVWSAPVNRLEDLASDEQVLANEYLAHFSDGFMGTPVPYEVAGWQGRRGRAGDYGEHTDEVLSELGLSHDDILQLRVDEVIW